MDLKVFEPEELPVVLRALRHVASANGRFTESERALIEGVARVHQTAIVADTLEPISFEEVARLVVDPHRRKRAVQLAIVVKGSGPPEVGKTCGPGFTLVERMLKPGAATSTDFWPKFENDAR